MNFSKAIVGQSKILIDHMEDTIIEKMTPAWKCSNVSVVDGKRLYGFTFPKVELHVAVVAELRKRFLERKFSDLKCSYNEQNKTTYIYVYEEFKGRQRKHTVGY